MVAKMERETMPDLELLGSLQDDTSSENTDSLWRQLMVFKAFSENDLSEARSRRAEAEQTHKVVTNETAQATTQAYEAMKADAEQRLKAAEEIRAEAARVLGQAEEQRDQIVAEGRVKAQQIQDNARADAENEIAELRQHALKEIKATLARVDTIRAATDEELEAQRIFTNIARLKANSPLSMFRPTYELPVNSVVETEAVPELVPAAASTNGHAASAAVEETKPTASKSTSTRSNKTSSK
jgi:F0F1-type ATP synthase membrane subunit b/b'